MYLLRTYFCQWKCSYVVIISICSSVNKLLQDMVAGVNWMFGSLFVPIHMLNMTVVGSGVWGRWLGLDEVTRVEAADGVSGL